MIEVTKSYLKENKPHGDRHFPLAVYFWDQQGGDIPIVDCHWHKEVEFFYCIEGEVLFQINHEFVHVRQGEAVFIDSEEVHTGHSIENFNCRFAAIVLDTKLLDSVQLDKIQTQFILPLHEQRRSFPRHIKQQTAWELKFIEHLHSIINGYEQQLLGYELIIKAQLLQLLQLIHVNNVTVNRTATKKDLDGRTEKLKRIISYIHEHYNKRLKISELAQLVPMSEGHFCRFFKKMTRQTVTEFINSYRITKAATLLRDSDMKISTIAYEVGFEHLSYFIKLFKHHYSCSPSAYRQQH